MGILRISRTRHFSVLFSLFFSSFFQFTAFMWFILLLAEAAAAAPVTAFNVEWSEPSSGPGTTVGGAATYMDAMPCGNGRVTVSQL